MLRSPREHLGFWGRGGCHAAVPWALSGRSRSHQPPAPLRLAGPSGRRISFQPAPALCPALRLFSLVLVTLSDCSRISSQVSLFSAITTLLFFFLSKYIPLSLSLSEGLKVVPFSFLCARRSAQSSTGICIPPQLCCGSSGLPSRISHCGVAIQS